MEPLPEAAEVTRLLVAAQNGDAQAASHLLPLVYRELRHLAASRMARESSMQTLQATALVHEAWLRVGGSDKMWENRAHFFAAAAEAMRRILIDRARRRQAARRGGGAEHVNSDDVEIAAPAPTSDDELLAVNEALDKLAAQDARKAELVKLHYFVGLTFTEAADILGISEPTARRWWTYTKAWLYQEIRGETPGG